MLKVTKDLSDQFIDTRKSFKNGAFSTDIFAVGFIPDRKEDYDDVVVCCE